MGTNPVGAGAGPFPAPANPITQARDVQFTTKGIQPPSALYVTREDVLLVGVTAGSSNLAMLARARILMPDGNVTVWTQAFINGASFQRNFVNFVLPEGALLSLVIQPSGTGVKWGNCYVMAALVREAATFANITEVLLAGYASTAMPQAWPAISPSHSLTGMGLRRTITGTQPGAGAELSETVPTGAVWQLINFRATLAASAAVANRVPVFQVTDGTNQYGEFPSQSNQTAGTTWAYDFGGFPYNLVVTQGNVLIGGLTPFFLDGGYKIKTTTNNIQAADQWSAPQYVVLQWLEVTGS